MVTTKPDGMGLGLAVSQAIIEAHGGGLGLAPNQLSGAVFTFNMPAHHAA